MDVLRVASSLGGNRVDRSMADMKSETIKKSCRCTC